MSTEIKSLREDLKLSQRQFDCLVMVLHGESAKRAAEGLNISYRTVETHLRILRTRLNISRIEDARQILKSKYGNQYLNEVSERYVYITKAV
jgi:DNA-binding CsgD family transcriptional regulator